jgi:hypothetical protein
MKSPIKSTFNIEGWFLAVIDSKGPSYSVIFRCLFVARGWKRVVDRPWRRPTIFLLMS